MSATLEIEFMAGDHIEKAFAEAIKLSQKLDVCIKFKFNDTQCFAYPNSNVKNGVKAYHQSINTKNKMAFAWKHLLNQENQYSTQPLQT